MDLSFRALKKVSVFTQNLTLNLEPVYGILLAFLIYNEHKTLGPSFYAGISIIILTVVLQTLKVWRDSKTQLDKN
jgi:drug/metabolite transporter (DMT)-like permease